MKHQLHRGVLGPCPTIPITADEFNELRYARQSLFVLLGIEEKFRMLVENYVEYEHEILGLALEHMTRHTTDWSSMEDAKALINRRLANLLCIARLYIDQVKHDLAGIYGADHEVPSSVVRALSEQYDHLLGYRVMETLRNSLQHRSLPVTGLRYPAGWDERRNPATVRHLVTPMISIEELRNNGAVKPSVIDELARGGPAARVKHFETPGMGVY